MHKPSLLRECADPADIRDVDTGRRLLGMTRVGGFLVWYWARYAEQGRR